MRTDIFRNPIARNTFHNKYAQGTGDTWNQLAYRVVDDVCGTCGGTKRPILSKEERDLLVQIVAAMKFIPGGRYLYYAGRELHAWNNCFDGSEELLTTGGWRRMDSFVEGESLHLWSPVAKTFLPATMHCHGAQPLTRIEFTNLRGRNTTVRTVLATADHRWPTQRGTVSDLHVGDVVPAVDVALPTVPEATLHGMVFADGNVHHHAQYYHQLRLCGTKATHLALALAGQPDAKVTYPPFAKGDPVLAVRSATSLKELPSTDDPAYIASFLRGWVLLDGSKGASTKIHTIDKGALEYFIRHAALAGMVVTGHIEVNTRPTNFAKQRNPLYSVTFRQAATYTGFKVKSITPAGTAPVYCPSEPVHERFTLRGGIDTFNCYMLCAESDTREEWAALCQRAMSCLSLGGGIGACYSILRPSGRMLKRTGGKSSGPIPLMQAINEIGRNVMQGGSRRSAIYASLAREHEDVFLFLRAKNWDTQFIGNSGLTLADIKQQDFNFPAPLDMTNISVDYTDEWLKTPNRHLDPVFLENVRQALRTGEPGFSFNFGSKQNEVLRNACTELVSEDDSDVCNLGSVNLSAIESLEDLATVTRLAAKFLVCGTMRADLPYDKVYKVREQNRRLGLGLMGMHEWLLRRGHTYAMNDELRQWLSVWRDESEAGANEHCDRFYLSRPKGYRAIAPTGTLGLIAGTTTGIEPIFSVATKRRYLVSGTDWRYEYVIDHTAQTLIDQGIDPEKIETASDIAQDYRRRIAFQADVQDYVDHAISSTINLPSWGSDHNNEDMVTSFAATLSEFAPRLRGFTCYPDGSRGGQPLVAVPYAEAKTQQGVIFEEHDSCKGGVCGL